MRNIFKEAKKRDSGRYKVSQIKGEFITIMTSSCFYSGGYPCEKCAAYKNNRCTVYDKQ